MSTGSSEKIVVMDVRRDPLDKPADKPINPDGKYELTCDCKTRRGEPCRYRLVIKGSMVEWGKDIMRRHIRKTHNLNVVNERRT